MILLPATATCHRCGRSEPASVEVYAQEFAEAPGHPYRRTMLGPIHLPAGWQTTAEGEWRGCGSGGNDADS